MSSENTLKNSQKIFSQKEKAWAMLIHLSCLLGLLVEFAVTIDIPFLSLIGYLLIPGILWGLKSNSSSYIDHHGKEALNFQITILIATLISFLLVFVFIGVFFLAALPYFNAIMIFIAAVKAFAGDEKFNYFGFSIRIL